MKIEEKFPADTTYMIMFMGVGLLREIAYLVDERTRVGIIESIRPCQLKI